MRINNARWAGENATHGQGTKRFQFPKRKTATPKDGRYALICRVFHNPRRKEPTNENGHPEGWPLVPLV
jgi:hypothetical protein